MVKLTTAEIAALASAADGYCIAPAEKKKDCKKSLIAAITDRVKKAMGENTRMGPVIRYVDGDYEMTIRYHEYDPDVVSASRRKLRYLLSMTGDEWRPDKIDPTNGIDTD